MKPLNNRPPQSVEKFLSKFCKEELLDEIIGDLHEYYYDLADLPLWKRRIVFWFQVLNFLRPFALRGISEYRYFNNIILFRSYFKISQRNIIKNPLSSFINIFGLAVAIGCCLVTYAAIEFDNSIDQFHENKNEIYLATFLVDRVGMYEQYGMAPAPIGEILKKDFKTVKRVCQVEDKNVVVKYGDKVYHEQVRLSDPEFLEMFTFPLKWGLSSSLSGINNMILSEEMAYKYFGEENPLGKELTVKFDGKSRKTFTITGVAEPFPEAHVIAFDFLINFENIHESTKGFNPGQWSDFISGTLVQVSDTEEIPNIEQGMEAYRRIQSEAHRDWEIDSFILEPLTGLHKKSSFIKGDLSFDDNVELRKGLPLMALFILALACFNYINIAISSTAKRLNEIAVRKVIGANKGTVMTQFLVENICITIFAGVLGILLTAIVFLPWFIDISKMQLELNLLDINFWFFLVLLLLLTGITSGIYPAFYISRFQVTTIFQGSVQFGRKNLLTKTLLGTQLIMACTAITGAVMFVQNNSFQVAQSWGYNPKQALYMHVPDGNAFSRFNQALSQNTNVLAISGSSHHIGKELSSSVVHLAGRKYEVDQLSVDEKYFETMGIQLLEGRIFLPQKDVHAERENQAVIVNEEFVQTLGFAQPVGRTILLDNSEYEVIGVIKDFHNYDFYQEIHPMVIKLANPDDYRYLSMRIKSGAEEESLHSLKTLWGSIFPDIPFQGGYQEEVWGSFFQYLTTAEKFYKVIAYIAVLLAGLGLYGLVSLNVAGRTREFSIMIAMGAGLKNLTSSVLDQYLFMAAVSLIVGLPVSYFLIKANLDLLYAYPTPMTFSGMALSIFILIFILLAILSTQIRKVYKLNPVNGLKVK